MTDEAFRGPEHIPERDAEANLLNHLKVDGQMGIPVEARRPGRALFEYLVLMLSWMASMLFFRKSSGVIWTKSAILVLGRCRCVRLAFSLSFPGNIDKTNENEHIEPRESSYTLFYSSSRFSGEKSSSSNLGDDPDRIPEVNRALGRGEAYRVAQRMMRHFGT